MKDLASRKECTIDEGRLMLDHVDEEVVRNYIKHQEGEGQRIDQLDLF